MRTSFVLAGTAVIVVAIAAFLSAGSAPNAQQAQPASLAMRPVLQPPLSVMAVAGRAEEPLERKAAIKPPASETSASAEPFPFRVLGRVAEGSVATVYLFGNGRIWKITAPGPLDADYAVDAIDDQHLLLRHLHLNISKTLELAPPPAASVATPKAEDYPQD
ncbi:hypothetical protein SNE35_20680 [Paucibacter sp. R3-3]|uniref:Type II secretion system protein GspC N-terminal domain-containing protein n=1 Tax=Roseateles agri TaxID=3098619 RepID=A0ABU5DMH8_9BURK|nr:hypothetical protein [Paucibacter sp. R3-3]MDY0746941.1 hypothetical protein [Paucibacter sp. R3-3]